MNFPILNTNRLFLRQIQQEDIGNVLKGLSDSNVIQYYGISYKTLEETQQQIDWYKDLEKNKTGIYWAICSLDNTVFYGIGGFNQLSMEYKKAEIGFWLLPNFWNNGFMQEAFPVICSFGFEKLDLNRIEGFVEKENINCRKSIEKMGFTLEGIMRECEIKNDQFLDVCIYSKLKKENCK